VLPGGLATATGSRWRARLLVPVGDDLHQEGELGARQRVAEEAAGLEGQAAVGAPLGFAYDLGLIEQDGVDAAWRSGPNQRQASRP
jgi:hypothetical protein